MNILQLCKFYPPIFGGIELVEKMLTKAHSSLGDSVNIVAFKNNIQKDLKEKGEFDEPITWINMDIKLSSAPINFSFWRSFLKIVKDNKIERIYVHLPNPYMHELVRFYKKELVKSHVEVIAIYHSDIINQKILNFFYNPYFLLSSKIYDQIIVSSDKLWDFSPVLTKIDIKKRVVVPFCTDRIDHSDVKKVISNRLVTIGRLVPYKGYEFLINAINKTNYQLDIIGDGPLSERLKSLAGKNIHFHSRVSDEEKIQLMNNADLVIMSSINRAEAYGMTIVEAFERSRPVVAANINTGVTYLVQHNFNGKIFNVLDENDLLLKISEALIPSEYKVLSVNAKKTYEEKLSPEAFREHVRKL